MNSRFIWIQNLKIYESGDEIYESGDEIYEKKSAVDQIVAAVWLDGSLTLSKATNIVQGHQRRGCCTEQMRQSIPISGPY